MGKKKNSLSLFEVISKRVRQDIEVPPWMANQPDQESAEVTPKVAEEAPVPAPLTAARVPSAEPAVSTTGGRLRLSLSQTSCVIVALVLLGLLIGAFLLGRIGVTAGPQTARQTGAGSTNGQETPPGDGRKPLAQLPERIPGKYYLVIQGLQGLGDAKLAEAQRIAKYCTAHGEPANAARYNNPRTGKEQYIVWSRTPFTTPNSPAARQHALAIEEMGKRYFGKYKTYNFKHTRDSQGRIEPWYEKYIGN
ncbi:MAG: hypothetical protein SVT52_07225 [Planctomycetota bacterium]|nr:hypothetical protein [Planctomycetota bacterium]